MNLMSRDYGGMSFRQIYSLTCEQLHCKKNSELLRTLPNQPGVFTSLHELDLSTNFVGPKGLLPVLEVVKVSVALRVLSLRDNQLSNQSVQDIVDVCLSHRSLTKLDVSQNPITLSAGRALLELAQRNPLLQSIVVDDTNVRQMLKQSIASQCRKNARTIELQQMVASRGSPLTGGTLDPSTIGGEGITNPAVVDGVLDGSTVRRVLQSIAHTLHPILFDTNPADSFILLCEQHGAKFRDPQFPPDISSVQPYKGKDYGVAGWRRLSDIAADPKLFSESGSRPTVASIRRGASNTGWILAGLSEILRQSRDNNPLSLIEPAKANPFGVYAVRFHIDGKWRWVLIDDFVPCDSQGLPTFLRPFRGEELWILLLEKAIAKLHGTYQTLDADVPRAPSAGERAPSAVSLMTDLTGGVGVSRDLNHAEFDPDQWWEMLVGVVAKRALVVTEVSAVEAVEEKRALGLVPNGAYTLEAARLVNGFKLVYLRSMIPEEVWQGEWGDCSPLWDQYSDVTDTLRHRHDSDRGAFWMPYAAYLKYFGSVSIARLFPGQNAVLVEGKWDAESGTAGGPNFEGRWCFNPHFEIRVEATGPFFVQLSLPDRRFLPPLVDTIAFHVVKADYFPLRCDPDNLVVKTQYVISDAVSHEGQFEKGRLWIVPSTYASDQTSPFLIRLFSPSLFSLVLQPIQPYWKQFRLKSKWTASGEYQNGEDNPQFDLTIPGVEADGVNIDAATQASQVVVRMAVDTDREYSLVLFLCASEGQGRLLGSIPEEVIICRSKYLIADSVTLATSLPSGKYVVVCCCQPERSISKCDMDFWCSNTKFSVTELPMWNRKEITTELPSSGVYQSGDNQPQYELVVPFPMRVVIKMSVSLCTDPAIGFFVIDNSASKGKAWRGAIPDSKVLLKSYVRHDVVTREFDIKQPSAAYLIVACVQPPGARARVKLSVASPSDDFQLSEVLRT
eukprot:TRINITY_DN41142_c0_g1_i1.p1 TRINITY_DN41142_c0_g1~~TRINITY_DN41142_c0_g1_i1.p1  ORF type:complete len:956 (-),score=166.96 TRINITY_DN41142_c0_g1_i1:31-2898(-)